jgi:hypothetical protein
MSVFPTTYLGPEQYTGIFKLLTINDDANDLDFLEREHHGEHTIP